ncbi:hypothetical protein ABZ234_08010 [Nocardiopsis sp. NPDC006198]|uniref:hypothetical protein n=1 Tax=Nocardiopsis sp. NPDC006198 TaxID=3154472 RepID=UPI0033AC8BD8
MTDSLLLRRAADVSDLMSATGYPLTSAGVSSFITQIVEPTADTVLSATAHEVAERAVKLHHADLMVCRSDQGQALAELANHPLGVERVKGLLSFVEGRGPRFVTDCFERDVLLDECASLLAGAWYLSHHALGGTQEAQPPHTDRNAETAYLHTLIESGRTKATERSTARRMLSRLTAAAPDSTAKNAAAAHKHTYGIEYADMATLSAAEIAKRIRADIRLALKVAKAVTEEATATAPFAALPDGMKITAKINPYSTQRSVRIVLRDIPRNWWMGNPDEGEWRLAPGPELEALSQALREIHEAYEYCETGAMHTDFTACVCTERGTHLVSRNPN